MRERAIYDSAFDYSKLYWSPIRTACAVFAGVFSSIEIERKAGPYKVPINFSSMSNAIAWITDIDPRTPDATIAEIRKTFPAMAFSFKGISFDQSRQINPLLREHNLAKSMDWKSSHAGAYYNMNFELSIYAKDMTSSLQVLNEILPSFKPELAVKVDQRKEIRLVEDCKIVLESISQQDNAIEGFSQNRMIQWDLEFKMNGIFFDPPRKSSVVSEVSIDFEA
jgi:hypothetical protein